MQFLSQAWCSQVHERAATQRIDVPDVAVTASVTGGPDGTAGFSAVVADGIVTHLDPGPLPDGSESLPVIALKTTWADAVRLATGAASAAAAFMTGTVKTDGPTGPLLALIAALDAPATGDARNQLAAETTFA